MARTAKQRAALRKAQLASARKRKGRGKLTSKSRRRRVVGVAIVGGAIGSGALLYADHQHAKRIKAQRQAHKEKLFNDYVRYTRRVRYQEAQQRAARARQRASQRPRFVPSTRGPGMPLNPQLALPRGSS